jgi:hypothetical protein
MNIREQLKAELSMWNTDLVSEHVGEDQDRFRELWNLLFPEEYPISPRAAWAIEAVCVKHPHLLKPYMDELLKALAGVENHGIKRHMMKILTFQEIPEERLGNLIDLCFLWIEDPDIPVAVKVHSMQIIFNTISQYPELKAEFVTVVEDQIPKNSSGFKSRARSLIGKLYDIS